MSSKYGWIITVDHIENSEKPIIGPSDISPEMTARLIVAAHKNHGQKFKMYDDDGELYYSGTILGDYDGFEPLDDYGTPNAGCTDIKLYNSATNEWESL
jgi:hypothetical protein